MPFTAFHAGAALLGKGVAPKSQSVVFFMACQVAIDLEPAFKMATGSTADLHQVTHHPAGAVATALACVLAWGWAQRQAWWWSRLPVLSWRILIWTALWSALSHWGLDAMSHADIPGSVSRWFGIEDAEATCVAMGVFGLFLLGIRWLIADAQDHPALRVRRSGSDSAQSGPPAPPVQSPPAARPGL